MVLQIWVSEMVLLILLFSTVYYVHVYCPPGGGLGRLEKSI